MITFFAAIGVISLIIAITVACIVMVKLSKKVLKENQSPRSPQPKSRIP